MPWQLVRTDETSQLMWNFHTLPFYFVSQFPSSQKSYMERQCNSIPINKNVTSALPGDVHQEKDVYSDDV